jgi:hypothetical protein
MALEREWEVFRKALPEWLADPEKKGMYALLANGQFDSVWPTLNEALKAGYERFGLTPFLAQHIAGSDEEAVYFSRNIKRCPS